MVNISKINGFEWDMGNVNKNKIKHGIDWQECEEVFFNIPLTISPDIKHSGLEERLHALGKTNERRLLFLSFTIRNNKIRVISARDMNKKERIVYEKTA